jgi:hypothetical protein
MLTLTWWYIEKTLRKKESDGQKGLLPLRALAPFFFYFIANPQID